MPASDYDGFGFGGYYDSKVMFFKRAASGYPSAWNVTGDTSAAVQPLNFTVYADAVHEVTVSNIVVDTGGAAPDFIFSMQESGAALGGGVTHTSPWNPTPVALDAPVVVAPGTSKTFTLFMNSGAFGQTLLLNNMAIIGSAERIPSPLEAWAAGFGLENDDLLPGADPDEDQADNLLEYALGGNPTNALDTGYPVRFNIAGSAAFLIHPQRSG